jgi:hypothetical protein
MAKSRVVYFGEQMAIKPNKAKKDRFKFIKKNPLLKEKLKSLQAEINEFLQNNPRQN